jgi:hypothetical protein
VLLVVFGAGASHDCMVNDEDNAWKPPLTQAVFDLTQAGYSAIARDFPQASPIMDEIAQRLGPDGPTLEEELSRVVAEAEFWPDRKKGLKAVQFYLSELFRRCSTEMAAVKASITTYSRLLTALERWRTSKGEAIAFVTFNYDTIFDDSLRQYTRLSEWDHYLTRERAYFKVHGSVDWARQVAIPGDEPPRTFSDLIYEAPRLAIGSQWDIRTDTKKVWSNGEAWAPAIAVPIESKDEFQMPQEMIEALERTMPRVTNVLTIGWRAREQGFLELLRTVPPQTPTTVVTRSEVGTQAVDHQLRTEAGIERIRRVAMPFREFVAARPLEEFVGRLVTDPSISRRS